MLTNLNAQAHFMGKDGFVWWIGVVEDRKDPLKLGRARVRIFGWHTGDLSLKTEDLPWALALVPLNNPSGVKSPPEGTWVFGCFLDGMVGQQPLMIGVVPGYRTREPEVTSGGG